MRIPGVKTAKAFSRWWQARLLGGALILGYHRIASPVRDEYEVCVGSEHFAEQMELVSRRARPIRLSQLVQELKAGSVPPRSIAVTFDDGYADNLYQAKPILEKYGVPATVFICTGYAGREFWWDELERLIMSSRSGLHALRLQLRENRLKWEQPEVSPVAGSPEDGPARTQHYHALYRLLLSLDVEDQNHIMDIIRIWSGVSSDETSTSRGMNHQELRQLVEGGLIEFGSHTRNHPMLPQLSVERQRQEILSGKKDLEELVGKPVTGFAYPNGRATEAGKRIVREAGFIFACTSLHDMVRPGSDLYALTRFWQKDLEGDKFMQGLRLWMKI
jgi:peptidoglycan/xylan/chitin deacetylase (PgdA/CDA1 family)